MIKKKSNLKKDNCINVSLNVTKNFSCKLFKQSQSKMYDNNINL